MSYEIEGTVKRVNPTTVRKERYKSRGLVLTVPDGKFEQIVELEASGDRCEMLDAVRPGDVVRARFDLRGREWSGPNGVRVFNTLSLWKVEQVRAASSSSAPSRREEHEDEPPF